jgi:hypothetical protein
MSDAQRCEPPEHLRGEDGWHWLSPLESGRFAEAMKWYADTQQWVAIGCNADADLVQARRFWTYLSPVAPPDLVRALVEALVECSDDLEAYVNADNEHASRYPAMEERRQRDLAPVLAARAALHRAKEAGL